MKINTKNILVALLATSATIFATWWYGQYWAAFLGVVTGILRIILFWDNPEEGLPLKEHGLNLPAQQMTPEDREFVVHKFETYAQINEESSPIKHPPKMLLVLVFFTIVYLLDKRMIFYCFLMSLFSVWIWFQLYVAYKVERRKI